MLSVNSSLTRFLLRSGVPACRKCELAGYECIYDFQSDRRKPFTKDVVAAMQSRIEALEEELTQLRLHGSRAASPLEDDSAVLRRCVT